MGQSNSASGRFKRRILRAGIRILPKGLTHALIRNSLKLPRDFANIRFKLAETRDELEAAFKILHDAYVESGFIKPRPSGLYVSLQHALPSTSTLIAKLADQVIGTVTLVRDNPFGLPLEKAFSTRDLRRTGERVAEVSSLAIHPDFRREYGGQVLFPLFCFLYRYAVQYYGLHYFTIAVYPRHAVFYEAIFGFRQLTDKVVPDYLGAPATALFVDLNSAPVFSAIHYRKSELSKNVYDFFAHREIPEFQFPDRLYGKISDPVMTPECLDYFFNRRTDIFAHLSEKELKILANVYKDANFSAVIPSSDNSEWDRPERFDVDLKGRLELRGADGRHFVNMRILDVSHSGFSAVLNRDIRGADQVQCDIALNDFESVKVKALSKWNDGSRRYGFEIVETCPRWNEFIGFLTSDLYKIERRAG